MPHATDLTAHISMSMYDPLTTTRESALSQQQAHGCPLGKASVPGLLLVFADLRELT